jgi:hypothetical protein
MNLLTPQSKLPSRMKLLGECILVLLVFGAPAQGVPVVDWLVGQGTPATSNMDTNCPTIGDGSAENADASIIFASFPSVTPIGALRMASAGTT